MIHEFWRNLMASKMKKFSAAIQKLPSQAKEVLAAKPASLPLPKGTGNKKPSRAKLKK